MRLILDNFIRGRDPLEPPRTPSDPLGPPRFPSQAGGSGEKGVPADGDGVRKKCWSMEKNIEFGAPQARQSVPGARYVLGWSQGCVEWLMSLILDKSIRGHDPLGPPRTPSNPDPLGPPLRRRGVWRKRYPEGLVSGPRRDGHPMGQGWVTCGDPGHEAAVDFVEQR